MKRFFIFRREIGRKATNFLFVCNLQEMKFIFSRPNELVLCAEIVETKQTCDVLIIVKRHDFMRTAEMKMSYKEIGKFQG